MNNTTPFRLQIFIVDGDPDGLRLVDRSNWNGKVVVFPRASYAQVRNRDEFKQTGVYLLIGPRTEGDGDMLYIGEGDPVKPRLDDHFAKKDFWTRAVFVVAELGQLNKAHVQFLESRLVGLARAAKRMPLDNGNVPTEPTLSEADRAVMSVFLDNMLGILPVLGIQAFEQSPIKSVTDRSPILTCQGKGIVAKGYDTPQGFVVQTGSQAARENVPSLAEYHPNICKTRVDLQERGVLEIQNETLRFTQDYTFTSPSMASMVILARSSNGRTDWKDSNGRTLKEIQEMQAQS